MPQPPDVDAEQGDYLWLQLPSVPVTSATTNQVSALPGFYLMFLVTNLGYVSDGRWIQLQ